MNRLNKLAKLYNFDPSHSKKKVGEDAFIAGFVAARKMCAVMGKIAQLEKKDAQVEILKVGTELEVAPLPDTKAPDILSPRPSVISSLK
jgi:hypothetical protein